MKKHTHFNHILLLAFMALFFATDAKAVLKEENLERTLFILHNELNVQYKEQATRAAIQKRRREDMKNRIIEVWRKSNQNALMLYSQKQDYVFDLTYACHEATQQYQEFTRVQDKDRHCTLRQPHKESEENALTLAKQKGKSRP